MCLASAELDPCDSCAVLPSAMFLTNLHHASEWLTVLQTKVCGQETVRTLSPGQIQGWNVGALADRDEVLLIVAGEVTAEVGEEKARMHPGDVLIIPAGISHRLINQGDVQASTLSAYTPLNY